MLSVIFAECHIQDLYAECQYAKFHYVIMLSGIAPLRKHARSKHTSFFATTSFDVPWTNFSRQDKNSPSLQL